MRRAEQSTCGQAAPDGPSMDVGGGLELVPRPTTDAGAPVPDASVVPVDAGTMDPVVAGLMEPIDAGVIPSADAGAQPERHLEQTGPQPRQVAAPTALVPHPMAVGDVPAHRVTWLPRSGERASRRPSSSSPGALR